MEVGSLVRDVVQDDIGIVTEISQDNPPSGSKLYKVLFASYRCDDDGIWLADTFLEVIK